MTKKSDVAPDVLGAMQALWALAHALEARSKRMHRELGITGPQRLLLRVVGQSPGIGPGFAARALSLHPGTVTRLAAGLERKKLIRREADPLDVRKQRMVLTPRGKRLNRQHRGTVEGAVREALAKVRPEDFLVARKFIQQLTDSLAE